ncbi:hypothetical protein POL68_26840 [Stigmatella sp. ncwal1]|uniref:Uncharacterized protein n=1 Tax=Stigmatella ashevillensis TaxID=2995309 RepID=A0ABT5DIH1_9BACT|nr:hypothetical protein [Stigmatella ashevillena]MDC0712112.1 hypothetical protein [Stigmatella ashevillena]
MTPKATLIQLDPTKQDVKTPLPTELQAVVEPSEGITLVNDTGTPVSVLVNNGFLGPASSGFVPAGQRLVLPCVAALWDVYALFANSSQLFIQFHGPFGFTVFRNKQVGNVSRGTTINVSQMNNV